MTMRRRIMRIPWKHFSIYKRAFRKQIIVVHIYTYNILIKTSKHKRNIANACVKYISADWKKEFLRFQVLWIYNNNGSLVSAASQWYCHRQETRCCIYCSKCCGAMGGAMFTQLLKALPINCFDYLARTKSIPGNCTGADLNSSLGRDGSGTRGSL